MTSTEQKRGSKKWLVGTVLAVGTVGLALILVFESAARKEANLDTVSKPSTQPPLPLPSASSSSHGSESPKASPSESFDVARAKAEAAASDPASAADSAAKREWRTERYSQESVTREYSTTVAAPPAFAPAPESLPAPSPVPSPVPAAAPPPEEPPPASAPPLADVAEQQDASRTEDIFWSSWFEKDCWSVKRALTHCESAPTLQAGHQYRLVLSLSAEAISTLLSTPAQHELRDKIRKSGDDTIQLQVVPIFADPRIQLSPDASKSVFKLPVRVSKLSMPVDPKAREDFTSGKSSIGDYGRSIAAGLTDKIKVIVKDGASGCAFVALSVWDESLGMSLDSLLVPVTIADGQDVPDCSSGEQGKQGLRNGLEALLASSHTSAAKSGGDSRAALQVFEGIFAGIRRSFAVFASSLNGKGWIGGWEMGQRLSDVVGNQTALTSLILQAREDLRGPQKATAYAIAARSLASRIFSADDAVPQSGQRAEDALSKLKQLTASAAAPLTLTARFTQPETSDSVIFFLPLRLLAAPGAGFTDQDFNEVQPLTYRRSSSTVCINHWTLIRPPETDGVNPAVGAAAPDPMSKRPWLGAPVTSIADMRAYFAAQPAVSPPSPTVEAANTVTNTVNSIAAGPPTPKVAVSTNAEGVILLAHHGANGISFENERDVLAVSDIRRTFPPGSAAILAACSVTNPTSNDHLVTRLNRRQFDAIVASPFPVDTEYAEDLVHRLIDVLDAAYKQNEPLTLTEIFHRAVASAAPASAPGPDDPDRAVYRQEGLEFVIAGDPSLRICGKEQEPTP
jgi:hypothetical protein